VQSYMIRVSSRSSLDRPNLRDFVFVHSTRIDPENTDTMSTSDQKSVHSEENEEIDVLVALGEALIGAIYEGASLETVKKMIEDGAPLWYQDNEGNSALHAAAYVENDEVIRLLIQEGAVWNAVDNSHNTAGDIALSFNNEICYTIIRDAGIRSGK